MKESGLSAGHSGFAKEAVVKGIRYVSQPARGCSGCAFDEGCGKRPDYETPPGTCGSNNLGIIWLRADAAEVAKDASEHVTPADRAGIASFVPPDTPPKAEAVGRVSSFNRSWRWL